MSLKQGKIELKPRVNRINHKICTESFSEGNRL